MASSSNLLRRVITGHCWVSVPALLLFLGTPLAAALAVWGAGWVWTVPVVLAALGGGYLGARRWRAGALIRWRIHHFSGLDEIDWWRLETLATRWWLLPASGAAVDPPGRGGDPRQRMQEVLERNAEMRALETLYFGVDAPRRYGFRLRRRYLLVSLVARVAIALVAAVVLLRFPRPYPGLVLLVAAAYPNRDWSMYRHLPFRGTALEISAAGVLLRVPELTMHYWHDYLAYRLYQAEAVLVLVGPEGRETRVDLTYYRIDDYRKLVSAIDTYIGRYSLRVGAAPLN
ncbi:hypothetical protein [Lewinella sp. IMCC34183]|uniref:hypothetical protein n=1 Tax=Lewinella sp. IMCC34183 TaxID=2248762 RepID=UPI000E2314F8|nr:hypothetical protein [Lewinella sp. IMCC34183]